MYHISPPLKGLSKFRPGTNAGGQIGEIEHQVFQIVVRKINVAEGEKRFLVDQTLWNQMNSLQQAGPILHEILNEHFALLGEENSIKARKFNSYLFSQNFNRSEFWRFVRSLDIAIYP